MIRCRCGEVKFDGVNYKGVSITQFSLGKFNAKCKKCKFWMEGLDVKILTGEIQVDIDYRGKEDVHGKD